MKLFKVRANYVKLALVEGEENKSVSENRLFEAISYKDAENQATEFLKNSIAGECEFDITKVSYDEIVPKKPFVYTEEQMENVELEETFWYEVRVTFIQDSENGVKYIGRKMLVEAEDFEVAIEYVKNHLADSQDEWFFTKMEETPIEEVIFLNLENKEEE